MRTPPTHHRKFLLSGLLVTAFASSLLAQTVPDTFTIQGYTNGSNPYQPPTLYLLDQSATGEIPGFSLSYTQTTASGITTGIVVQEISQSAAQWQWQSLDSSSTDKLRMQLDVNGLSLFDPGSANPTTPVIVINPYGTSPGITIAGQQVVTSPTAGNTGLNISGGNIGIGPAGMTIGQQLTITGNFALPATSSTGGAIYQGGVVLLSTYTPPSAIPYGLYNLYFGQNSGNNLIPTGSGNVGVGGQTLSSLTGGNDNTMVGVQAGQSITSGGFNVAVGTQALNSATADSYDVAVGARALYAESALSGSAYNTAVGTGALAALTGGAYNTAVGAGALQNTNFPNNWLYANTAVGHGAGSANTTGSRNTYLGFYAEGNTPTTGSNNIVIGFGTYSALPNGSNQLNIGNLIYGTGVTIDGTVSTGSVGIGTNTPAATLDVAGGATFNGQVLIPPSGDINMGTYNQGPIPDGFTP